MKQTPSGGSLLFLQLRKRAKFKMVREGINPHKTGMQKFYFPDLRSQRMRTQIVRGGFSMGLPLPYAKMATGALYTQQAIGSLDRRSFELNQSSSFLQPSKFPI